MSAAQPSRSSSGAPAKSSVDVRTLSLTQLQKLADRGSRRAKAELEGRMRAGACAAAPAQAASSVAPVAVASAPVPPPVPAPRVAMAPSVAHPPAVVATASVQAAPAAPMNIPTLMAHAATVNEQAHAPAAPQQALVDQLELIARQEQARSRADGPPRLVGMALMAWGMLIALGGLVMLTRGGGLYYVFCGAGAGAVGWLLFQCSRWALALHGLLVLVALAWAWRANASGGALLAAIQAAPLIIPALWVLARPVREPLE
ncbi:MAG: hypothetical protein Q4G71_16325 [Pseudomonadota bacterium]|nr:hypothetical protein [Pseudomonadota bacterium]